MKRNPRKENPKYERTTCRKQRMMNQREMGGSELRCLVVVDKVAASQCIFAVYNEDGCEIDHDRREGRDRPCPQPWWSSQRKYCSLVVPN